MKTENKELRKQAWEDLRGKWGLAIPAYAVFLLLLVPNVILTETTKGGINYSIQITALILSGPLSLGSAIFSLALARKQEARFSQIFEGFSRFGTAFIAYFLMNLFILLWALLLIIPGIIALLSYSQTFYILADDKSIKPMEAIDKSKKMMYGNKEQYFALLLRFMGLIILGFLTLGIAWLWIVPHMSVTFAKFYEDLKESQTAEAVPIIIEPVS